MSLLELLLADNVAEFNNTRGERAKVDLFGADLAQRELPGVDLSGADLDKADLTGADLTGATLFKARMSGIDGTGMKLLNALGAKAKLREAYLDDADLTGADFSQGDLSEAVLVRSRGRGIRLTGAKLKEADAKDVVWQDADLSMSHLGKADFSGADLSRCDLTEATGAEVGFAGARLDGAKGPRARLPAGNFQGASLVDAQLDAAHLMDGDFTGANLEGANFTGANLANVKLAGARLRGAVFAEANLEGVVFEGLDVTGVDLTGLDPVLLGLDASQRASLKVSGIPVAEGARIRPSKVAVARNGELVVAVWENDDGAELAPVKGAPEEEGGSTVRYAVRTPKGVTHGILPVTSASLLSRSAVASGDGVDLVLLRERPGRVVVERFHVGPDGSVGAGVSTPLGYEPQVVPVLQADGAGVRMWGLARRGPTLVVSADGPEGFRPVMSKAMPTALGFLGKHEPFLACKGGVVMPCGRTGPGGPLKRPEGFPGKFASATPLDDRWFALWVEPQEGKNKGGIRAAWLGTRATPEVESLTDHGVVVSIDCIASDGALWMVWAELHGTGDTQVFLRQITEHFDKPAVRLPFADVDDVTFAPGPGPGLVIAITTDEERTVFADEDGRVLGIVAED